MRHGHSWRMTRVLGIELRAHISLIVLLIYVMIIASVQAPFVAAQSGVDLRALSVGPAAWAFLFAIGLFVSIALHELGHALTARSMGVRVKSITLMVLGGVTQMERIPERRYAEFKLAIVGPLVSIAIGLVFMLIRRTTGSPDLLFYSYWLGTVNFALAIFNLLPAFPLDGGRALRSVLAARQGTTRATRVSVQISKVFAFALGTWAVLQFNLILILISFFIYTTAQNELLLLFTKEAIKGLRVDDLTVPMVPIREESDLRSAASRMLEEGTTVLPVRTSIGAPAILAIQDLEEVNRQAWRETQVREAMEDVATIAEKSQFVADILPELATAPHGTLPVRERNGEIIGVIRHSDLRRKLEFRALAHDTTEEPEKRLSEDRGRKPPRAA